MATAADLRQRVKDYLYSAAPHEHPFVALVAEALDATETDITLDTGVGDSFTAGDTIEMQAEKMRVTAVSTDTLTVIRGVDNTTASTHADNTPITKNPRFAVDQIDNALDSAVRTFAEWGVHGWGTGSVTLVASQEFYDLTETDIMDAYGVLSVYYQEGTTLNPVSLPFEYKTNLSTSVTTTGHGIRLWTFGALEAGDAAYFTYAQDIDAIGDLLSRQEELAVLGATVILLGGTIGPSTHDPGARTDRTVAPGQTSRDVRWHQGEFYIRVRAEAAQLAVERQRLPGSFKQKRARRWRD